MPSLIGECLKKAMSRWKGSSAMGPDAWRVAELKALPMWILDRFAAVLNLVEETGEWPSGLMTALVSLIPKDPEITAPDPLQLRPITVPEVPLFLTFNIALVRNNAAHGAAIAVELAALRVVDRVGGECLDRRVSPVISFPWSPAEKLFVDDIPMNIGAEHLVELASDRHHHRAHVL